MTKKTLFFILFAIFIFNSINSNIYAESVRNIIKKEIKPTIQTIKKEIEPTISAIRQETKEQIREKVNQATNLIERNEIKNEIREKNKGLLEEIKNQIKEKVKNLKFEAKIKGKIIEIGENYLKITTNDQKQYQVNITERTQLRRKFWGKSTLKEFKVDNEVLVIGKFTNEEKNTIEAVLIRNLSIQRRWGVFFGEATTVSQNYLIVKTAKRGELKVYLSEKTNLKNKKEEIIKWEDIKVNDKVRIKGVWDKDLKEIRETEEIKNFSLPLKNKNE
ncbi:MAG: hypothetical protein N2593_02750 [Patescibacteria group bacterium]|nr:hypothetical protein [Patescibacteria group bacterium]